MTQGYQHPVTLPGALRLHLNENTAGCSPRVIDAIRALSRDDLALYPDYTRVNAVAAGYLGVPVSSLLLTNGLDEGIFLAAVLGQKRRPADGPPESVVVLPAFDMYAITVDACGGRVVTVAPKDDFSFPLEATLSAITPRTRTVFITSPNNPTGVRVGNDAIGQVARALPPEAIVFVDGTGWTRHWLRRKRSQLPWPPARPGTASNDICRHGPGRRPWSTSPNSHRFHPGSISD